MYTCMGCTYQGEGIVCTCHGEGYPCTHVRGVHVRREGIMCTCHGEGYLCAHVCGAHVGCRASVCTCVELHMSRGRVSVCACQGESTRMHMCGGAHAGRGYPCAYV